MLYLSNQILDQHPPQKKKDKKGKGKNPSTYPPTHVSPNTTNNKTAIENRTTRTATQKEEE